MHVPPSALEKGSRGGPWGVSEESPSLGGNADLLAELLGKIVEGWAQPLLTGAVAVPSNIYNK